jgi:SAM-dependent methyltransferase
MSWDEGYTTDIPYTYGYYRELNPIHLRYALVNAGFVHGLADDFTYCELGFGHGVSLCMHATATSGHYTGTDFIPDHALFARQLTEASGATAQIHDDSFADFTKRDLPEFDVIALHGVWSWISHQNRQEIVDFVRRKLKLGGVFYVSYNTLPGWSQMLPLRNLLVAHERFTASPQEDMLSRVKNSLTFSKALAGANSAFFAQNQIARNRLDRISGQNPNYLAHEYFNRDWEPMYFHDLVDILGPTKVGFACSADVSEHLSVISKPARDLLDKVKNPIFQETVRDYVLNRQFRKDLFVKGARRLNAAERRDQLMKMSFVLVQHVPARLTEMQSSVGALKLREDVFRPLLTALMDDGGWAKSMTELMEYPGLEDRPFNMMARNIATLVAGGQIEPAQSNERVSATVERCTNLNREICRRAEHRAGLIFLASPVTGGGVHASRIEQLFLASWAKGSRDVGQLAREVWDLFKAQGNRLFREGKVVQDEAENLKMLNESATTFVDQTQQRFDRLMIRV